jgi:beta-ribofuranosylaminobenzene 5'-phosphate synthase
MSSRGSVFVEAPARLHFGVLDLRGKLGRCFGGLGAAIPSPSLLLEAVAADALTAEGPEADRALDFARRWFAYQGLSGGAHLRINRAIPSHSGLGSGTQLGLAVARALCELYGISADAAELARSTGRGQRSAIGTWGFALGGLSREVGSRAPGRSRRCWPGSRFHHRGVAWWRYLRVAGG